MMKTNEVCHHTSTPMSVGIAASVEPKKLDLISICFNPYGITPNKLLNMIFEIIDTMIPDTIRGKIRIVLMTVEQKTILSTKMAKIIPIVTSKKQETEANTNVL